MKIYVGRWDLLPEEWEGYNGLIEKSEEEIRAEISREVDIDTRCNTFDQDNNIAIYTEKEFEEAFNYDSERKMDSDIYWIRIF